MGHRDYYDKEEATAVVQKTVRAKLSNRNWVTITGWNLQKTMFYCIEERPGLPTISSYLPKSYIMYMKE